MNKILGLIFSLLFLCGCCGDSSSEIKTARSPTNLPSDLKIHKEKYSANEPNRYAEEDKNKKYEAELKRIQGEKMSRYAPGLNQDQNINKPMRKNKDGYPML